MQSLEAACEEAEHLLHIATKCPQFVPCLSDKTGKSSFDIHAQLRQLYIEECSNDLQQPQKQHLKFCSHLLEKLVAREQLNTIVISLYPGNKGYSITYKVFSKQEDTTEEMVETDRISYDEDQLLNYIDNEELPPELVDLLESIQPCLFYCGCVIAEVRDYRQAFPHFVCDVHHVLLKPSTLSLIGDVNQLAGDDEWSPEEKTLLESKLVLATENSLCLDTSPSLLVAYNRLQYQHRVLNTTALRKCARKFSQASINRKRKLEQLPPRCSLPLQDFLSRRKSKPRTVPVCTKLPKKPYDNGLPAPPCIPIPLEALMPDLPLPSGGMYPAQLARVYERPPDTSDCTPQLVEEFVLETDRPQGQIYHVKISIYQRPSSAEYLGEMYVDRDYHEDQRNGTSCRFTLGSRAHVNRYIHQFTEVFTEEGSKSVRIIQRVPGQPIRVSSTAAMKEREAKAAALQAQLQAQQQLQHLQAQMQARQSQQQAQVQAQPTQVLAVNSVVSPPPPPPPSIPATVTNTVAAKMSETLFQPSFSSNATPISIQNSMIDSVVSPPQDSISPRSASSGPSKTSRLATNPAISALVTSLMNSADEFQQKQNAASMAAAAANSSSMSAVTSPPGNSTILGLLNNSTSQSSVATASGIANLPMVSPSGNSTILSLLNNNSSSNSVGAQNKPGLARKRTWNLVNSRVLNNMGAVGSVTPCQSQQLQQQLQQQQQQQLQQQLQQQQLQQQLQSLRTCISPTARTQSANIGFSGSSAGVSTTKGQSVMLNHTSRINSVGAATAASNPKLRRLSSTAVVAESSSSTSNSTASSLGLSVPGLCALLAGSPSADNPIPGSTNNTSALLERLTTERLASSSSSSVKTPPSPYNSPLAVSSSPKSQQQNPSPSHQQPTTPSPKGPALTPSPMSSPPQQNVNVNLQRLSLANLQGLQNVQVSIPGLAVPISVLLNVPTSSQQTAGLIVTTLPITTATVTCTTITSSVMSNAMTVGAGTNSTMVLSNSVPSSSGTSLSLPVAQLMVSGGLKGLNAQTLRTIGSNSSVSVAQGTSQPIQLTLQRPRSIVTSNNKPVLTSAGILNPQRLKIATPNVVNQVSVATLPATAVSQPNQVPTLTAQQQLHLALQKKQAQLQQQCLLQQDVKSIVSPSALATKHRRRSSAADPNK